MRKRRGLGLTALAAVLTISLAGSAGAAAGDLDGSFDGDGVVSAGPLVAGSSSSRVADVLLDSDGRIVVLGTSSNGNGRGAWTVLRLNSDGSRDTTFGTNGVAAHVVVPGSEFCCGQQPGSARVVVRHGDGYLLGGGFATSDGPTLALARIRADGSLDTSFGDAGFVWDQGRSETFFEVDALSVASDGSITAAGGDRPVKVARFGAGGGFVDAFQVYGPNDMSFDLAGIAPQPDGAVIAAARYLVYDFADARWERGHALVKLAPDGSHDTSFADGGYALTFVDAADSYGAAATAVASDGSIVTVGTSQGDVVVVRSNPDGSLDSEFGGGIVRTDVGSGSDDRGTAVATAGDKTLVAGLSDGNLVLLRYDADGTLDESFGTGGVVETTPAGTARAPEGLAVDAQGRYVVGATVDEGFTVLRYLGDGGPPPPPANAAPTASFTISPASGTTATSFAFDGSGSSDPDGDALTYAWAFGDDATATGATTAHTYSVPGTYTATLTVSDGRGGSNATTRSVTVSAFVPPPPANFVVDDDRVQCPTASYTTIQSAIDAAPDGTTITVCAGLYPESVAVHNLVTLQGPGSDPTADCVNWGPANPTRDAIVDGDGIGLSLQVSGIVVDGLVVQGNATGIESSAEFGGFVIRDNVVAGNTFGIELGNGGDSPATVARNCITGNTRAGIHSPVLLRNATIDSNSFVVPPTGSESWGMFLGRIECCSTEPRVFDVTVSKNVAAGVRAGQTRFVELSSTRDVVVRENTATAFASTHVFLANNNHGTLIAENDFDDGSIGVWISDIGIVGGLRNLDVEISGNTIGRMDGYGIGVEAGNSLNGSTIAGNTITASGIDGIRVQGGANGGNTISSNTISGSDEHDCHDDTSGSGTSGTANTWLDNSASTSQPSGLCRRGTLSVSDASANEGEVLTFMVTLDRASGTAVTVDFATADGTAGASDYTGQSGTLTFAPGETAKSVSVSTTEDAADEADETLALNLENPENAAIEDGSGQGTIVDDDDLPPPAPGISISDASGMEGNAGTSELTFTLTRAAATGESRVDFATAADSATADVDYVSTSGTVVFGAGETQKTIAVQVVGDLLDEPNETLLVNLSNPQNATVADGQGQGTIVDDDDAPVLPANLAVTKTDSPDPVTVGADLTYSISVTNTGLGPARDVVLTDTLPAGVFFTFASVSQGSCTFVAPTVICAIGTLGSSAAALITIVVQPITPGTLTNSATATTSSADSNPANNTATTTTTANEAPKPPPGPQPQAKLDVIKTDAVDPVAVGQKLEYLITVDNEGDGTAANVRLDDSLTDGVQFVSATPSQGTCSNAGSNVQCQLGTIAAGASAEVVLVVRALRSGTVTNTARATTTSPANDDLNSDFEQTTVTPAAGDLAIEKTVFTPLERAAKGEQRSDEDRPGAGAVGLDLTYVLTAANDGPSPVASVEVEDQLPPNLTLKSVRTTEGTCTVGPKQTFIECALGELDSGENASITIVVRPTKAGRYTNVATIAGDAPDPVLVNNRSRVETAVVAKLPRIPIFRPACQFTGDNGANQFRGGPKHEVFCGYGGRDDIDAGRGNDVVFGGFGDDIVRVDLGLDYLDGEEGDDRIHAADGAVDVVIGGIGIDYAIVDRFDFVVGAEYVCIQTARRNCT